MRTKTSIAASAVTETAILLEEHNLIKRPKRKSSVYNDLDAIVMPTRLVMWYDLFFCPTFRQIVAFINHSP
ncbi:hypothetical protein Y032_0723g1844 [Ancylostoma ceylanicum]|uniref:Uncharacterized protein n=1 Tax=Ancylostoma ceylanicum TaxID=53326 RepID=A0A016WFF8_9BILA|nr:hypothetical protein Y032_0723g1844 [Ancylostoma ceylanicum]